MRSSRVVGPQKKRASVQLMHSTRGRATRNSAGLYSRQAPRAIKSELRQLCELLRGLCLVWPFAELRREVSREEPSDARSGARGYRAATLAEKKRARAKPIGVRGDSSARGTTDEAATPPQHVSRRDPLDPRRMLHGATNCVGVHSTIGERGLIGLKASSNRTSTLRSMYRQLLALSLDLALALPCRDDGLLSA